MQLYFSKLLHNLTRLQMEKICGLVLYLDKFRESQKPEIGVLIKYHPAMSGWKVGLKPNRGVCSQETSAGDAHRLADIPTKLACSQSFHNARGSGFYFFKQDNENEIILRMTSDLPIFSEALLILIVAFKSSECSNFTQLVATRKKSVWFKWYLPSHSLKLAFIFN